MGTQRWAVSSLSFSGLRHAVLDPWVHLPHWDRKASLGFHSVQTTCSPSLPSKKECEAWEQLRREPGWLHGADNTHNGEQKTPPEEKAGLWGLRSTSTKPSRPPRTFQGRRTKEAAAEWCPARPPSIPQTHLLICFLRLSPQKQRLRALSTSN